MYPMDGSDPPPHFSHVPTDTPSNPFCHHTPEADSVVSRQQYLESLHVEIEMHQCKMADLTAEATTLNACLSLLPPELEDHWDSTGSPWRPEVAALIPHVNHTNSAAFN